MDIQFIRENPAAEAFQRGQEGARAQLRSDLDAERSRLDMDQVRAEMPSRLRSVQANADLAQTRADVAQQTAPYEVSTARENATQAGQQSRLGDINVENSEMDQVSKVFDLLNSGDVETARTMAKQYGVDLPDSVVNNRLLIRQIKTLTDQAKATYPNSPRRQQQYLEEAVKGLTAGTQQQQNLSDPAYPFRVPNAPEPDMATGSAASAGRPLQFEVIQNAAKALGYSDEEAFAIASGRKPATDMELMELARKLTSMEMPSSDFRTSPEDRRQRYEAILADLRAKNGPAPTAAGASTPAGPAPATAAPAPNMQGQGTEQDPYQATSQDQVDWFKRSAPAGSVILIDGTLYVK